MHVCSGVLSKAFQCTCKPQSVAATRGYSTGTSNRVVISPDYNTISYPSSKDSTCTIAASFGKLCHKASIYTHCQSTISLGKLISVVLLAVLLLDVLLVVLGSILDIFEFLARLLLRNARVYPQLFC